MNEDTELTLHLKQSSPELYSRLPLLCSHVQQVLARIPAVFPEYTEHGWPHAKSVEQLSFTLFGDQLFSILSDYELFLLIVACWFHDIGMVGSIDENPEMVRTEHPLRSRKYLINNYRQLNLDRHEASILGKICHSHGSWDIEQWREEVLVKQEKVRLQLLCCLLGLCDVCDITSDRAPEIVYKIVKPGPESDNFWKTHLDIGGLNKNTNNEIWVSAEYKSSKGRYLIEEAVNLIQRELDLVYPVLTKYNFPISMKIVSQVDPIDPQLSEISFHKHLRAESILTILTKSLYKKKNVFVRELIQNAIDATRLRDALYYEDNYEPLIQIEINCKESCEFVIHDNGIGMDLYDIENHFAIPGSQVLDTIEIENLSEDKKSKLDKLIARFGIGILSCFLCCDSVEIETKKKGSNPLKFVIDDLVTKYGFIDSHKDSIGTKITAKLSFGFDKDFLLDSIRHYLKSSKHNVSVRTNGQPLKLEFDTDYYTQKEFYLSIFEHSFRGGIYPDFSGLNHLTVCQEGILIQDNLEQLLPKYALGIKGYLDIDPGLVDLTASRTEIEENDKYDELKKNIESYIKKLIINTAEKININNTYKEKAEFIRYLIEISYLYFIPNSFIDNLIVENFQYENLDGKYCKLSELLIFEQIYYCLEAAAYDVKRCRWLGQFIRSRIDLVNCLKDCNISGRNIIYLRSNIPKLDHLINIIKNYYVKNGKILLDITESGNFKDYIDPKSTTTENKNEAILNSRNIHFSFLEENAAPSIDLGDLIYLNLNYPQIDAVYKRLVGKSSNRITQAAIMAYCLMLGQRFDLAHHYISKIINFNDPPIIDHGNYTPSDYDLAMHKAQRLFYNGLFREAIKIIQRHGLQGPWAERLLSSCYEKLERDI